MSDEFRLSVVMATYNRAETLKQTIQCLAEQDLDPGAFEVIIIDDASPDNTPDMVEDAIPRVPFQLTYLRHDTNRGSGYTQNRGIRNARAPVILLMADDIWMVPESLRRHLAFHDAHPEPNFACMGRVLQSPDLNQSLFLRNWDPFRWKFVDDGVELPYYHFWANNVSFKRDFALQHGLFREVLGRAGAHAHDDSELGYRLHKAGQRIFFNAPALGYHYHFFTLDGAIARWYERGLNWGEIRELLPEPEIPVFYHVLNGKTLGDHVRAIFGARRKYLMGPNRNPVTLLLSHFFRLVTFNYLTAKFFWRPLFDQAEESPGLAKLMNGHFYRLFLYYQFVRGINDARQRYGS